MLMFCLNGAVAGRGGAEGGVSGLMSGGQGPNQGVQSLMSKEVG